VGKRNENNNKAEINYIYTFRQYNKILGCNIYAGTCILQTGGRKTSLRGQGGDGWLDLRSGGDGIPGYSTVVNNPGWRIILLYGIVEGVC
jgi:hypothetical protein